MEEEIKNHHSKNESISMLYVWFLYHMMNKELPFTIALPLTQKTYALGYILNQIQSSLATEKKNCPNFLRIFYYPKKNSENLQIFPKNQNIYKDLKAIESP